MTTPFILNTFMIPLAAAFTANAAGDDSLVQTTQDDLNPHDSTPPPVPETDVTVKAPRILDPKSINRAAAFDEETMSSMQHSSLESIEKAAELLNAGDYEGARKKLRFAELSNKSSLDGFMLSTVSYIFQDKPAIDNKALIAGNIHLLSSMVNRAESNHHVEKGRVAADTGDMITAAEHSNKAVALDEDNLDARKLRLDVNKDRLLVMQEYVDPTDLDDPDRQEYYEAMSQLQADRAAIARLHPIDPAAQPEVTQEQFIDIDEASGREFRQVVFYQDGIRIGSASQYTDTSETVEETFFGTEHVTVGKDKDGTVTSVIRMTVDGTELHAMGPDKGNCHNWLIVRDDYVDGAALDFSEVEDKQALAQEVAGYLAPDSEQRQSQIADYLEKRSDYNPKMQVGFTEDGSIMTSRKNKLGWNVVDVAKFQSGAKLPSDTSRQGPGETLAVYTYAFNRKGKLLTTGASANLPVYEYYGDGKTVEWHHIGVINEDSAGMRIELQSHQRQADGSWSDGPSEAIASWTEYQQPTLGSIIAETVMHDVPVVSQALQIGNSAVKGVVGSLYMIGGGIAHAADAHDTKVSLVSHAWATWSEVGVSMPWDNRKADAEQRKRESYINARASMRGDEVATFDERVESRAFQQGWRNRQFQGKAGSAHKLYRQLFGDAHKTFDASYQAFDSYGFHHAPNYFMGEAATSDSMAAKIGLGTLGVTTGAADAFIGGAPLGLLGEGLGMIKGVGHFLKIGAHAATTTPFLIGTGATMVDDVPLIIKGFASDSPDAQRQAFEALNRVVQGLVLLVMTGRNLRQAFKPTPKGMQLASEAPNTQMNLETHYQALGVKRGATLAEVNKAFRKKDAATHPDRFSDPTQKSAAAQRFKALNDAHQALKKSLDPASVANKPYAADSAPTNPTPASSKQAAAESPAPATPAHAAGPSNPSVPAPVQNFLAAYPGSRITFVDPSSGRMTIKSDNATFVYVPGVGVGQAYAPAAAQAAPQAQTPVTQPPGTIPMNATPFGEPIPDTIPQTQTPGTIPMQATPFDPVVKPNLPLGAASHPIPLARRKGNSEPTLVSAQDSATPTPSQGSAIEILDAGTTTVRVKRTNNGTVIIDGQAQRAALPEGTTELLLQNAKFQLTQLQVEAAKLAEQNGTEIPFDYVLVADPSGPAPLRILVTVADVAQSFRVLEKLGVDDVTGIIRVPYTRRLAANETTVEGEHIQTTSDGTQIVEPTLVSPGNAAKPGRRPQRGDVVAGYIDVPVDIAIEPASAKPRHRVADAAEAFTLAWENNSLWQSGGSNIKRVVFHDGDHVTIMSLNPKLNDAPLTGEFKELAALVDNKVTAASSQQRLHNMIQSLQQLYWQSSGHPNNPSRMYIAKAIRDASSNLRNTDANQVSEAYLWQRLSYGLSLSLNPELVRPTNGLPGNDSWVLAPVGNIYIDAAPNNGPGTLRTGQAPEPTPDEVADTLGPEPSTRKPEPATRQVAN